MIRTHQHHQKRLNEIASSYSPFIFLTTGIIFVVYTSFNALGITGDSQSLVLIQDSIIAAFAFGAAFVGFKKRIPASATHPLITLLCLGITVSLLHSLYLEPRPVFTILFMMFFLAISNIYLSSIFSLLTISISAASWYLVGYLVIPRPEFVDYSLAMMAVILTSFTLTQNRIAVHRRLISMHVRDERAKLRLAKSLESTKREISERQKAESEQNRLEQQLRQAQKMEAVGRLAGGVAHDINNMLAVVSGTTQALLLDLSHTPKYAEDLESILAACNRGKVLTSNLLGFAQKGKYRREQIDVNQLIRDVHTFMARTIPPHIGFEIVLADDLRYIEGDPGQINQVLINLVNNAVDAMENDGYLIISTENVQNVERQGVMGLEDASGDYIRIVVSDTGRGMKSGTIERAFEPFFSTKKMGQGTGLGLSMVYGTIANHGGAVLIRSALNQGTAVTIYLPEYNRNTLTKAQDSGGQLDEQITVGTVMLVDDEPLVRRSGTRILTQMGFTVVEASSGTEAIERYRTAVPPIDVVLLDLIMPGMEGDEVFSHLRTADPSVKVIFVSAYTRDTVRVDNLLAEGAIDFIQKPFSIHRIKTAISKAMAS